MEPNNTIIVKDDLRQSDQWSECLAMYGWKTIKTSKGVSVQLLKTGIGAFVKVQHPPALLSSDLEEIDAICKENKALFVKVEPTNGQDLDALQKAKYKRSGFLLTPTITIYIDLSKTENELWNDLSHSAKYSIKRAQREGAKVDICVNPPDEKLKVFYDMYAETAKKKKFSQKSYADFQKRRDVFGDKSYLITVYDVDGSLLSGKFYLGYKDKIGYIYGGTTEKGRHKSKAGYELMWQSFIYFKNLGYKYLDLEGIYDPRFPMYLDTWGGFSHFKEKFGGTIVEFPVPYVKYFNPIIKVISKLYGDKLSL